MASARRAGRRSPGPLEDFRQEEHGHVAAHAVAPCGDAVELAEHGVLQRRVAVVQLQRIGPAGEVRVAAVGEDAVAAGRDHPVCSSGAARPARSRSRRRRNVGVLIHPGVVGRDVVGHEVEDEPQPALARGARAGGRGHRRRRSRRGPCSRGPRSQEPETSSWKSGRTRRTRPPAGIGARDARAASPVCQTPRNQTRSKPVAGKPVQLRIGDVVQRRRPAEPADELRTGGRAC